jgi:hypothetical protein
MSETNYTGCAAYITAAIDGAEVCPIQGFPGHYAVYLGREFTLHVTAPGWNVIDTWVRAGIAALEQQAAS